MSLNSPNHSSPLTSSSESERSKVIDTMLLVETPEKISFQYQLAGPFRRVLAYILDILFSVVGYSILLVLFAVVLGTLRRIFAGTMIGDLLGAIMELGSGFAAVGFFVVYWFYGALMESWYNGQTLGKMILGYRVLSADGHAIDGVQALLRNFFRLLDLFPMVPIGFGPGIPTCMFGLVASTVSPKFQRIGDLVAGTIVVIDEKKWVPELATFSDPRVGQLAEVLPSDFVPSPSMLKTLAQYVDRRRFLASTTTHEIARQLAPAMIRKFGLPNDTDHDLLLCAMYTRAFLQADESPKMELALSSGVGG